MLWTIVLDVRHGGCSYGTTTDHIEADDGAEAERIAVEAWRARKPECSFHPLLVAPALPGTEATFMPTR